ncbi:hypothetical protein B0T19DRAFT_134377 [Cercophora scortea]|uniref:Uncharacterized protein n=1 Tax=Cercophora scortea TaxID=314031 RepID=A0AAE0MIQ7_9PEZI|nr:hypothetical protein B0T19DRAFT_134377 [Cercophora scortea]
MATLNLPLPCLPPSSSHSLLLSRCAPCWFVSNRHQPASFASSTHSLTHSLSSSTAACLSISRTSKLPRQVQPMARSTRVARIRLSRVNRELFQFITLSLPTLTQTHVVICVKKAKPRNPGADAELVSKKKVSFDSSQFNATKGICTGRRGRKEERER